VLYHWLTVIVLHWLVGLLFVLELSRWYCRHQEEGYSAEIKHLTNAVVAINTAVDHIASLEAEKEAAKSHDIRVLSKLVLLSLSTLFLVIMMVKVEDPKRRGWLRVQHRSDTMVMMTVDSTGVCSVPQLMKLFELHQIASDLRAWVNGSLVSYRECN